MLLLELNAVKLLVAAEFGFLPEGALELAFSPRDLISVLLDEIRIIQDLLELEVRNSQAPSPNC